LRRTLSEQQRELEVGLVLCESKQKAFRAGKFLGGVFRFVGRWVTTPPPSPINEIHG